MTRRRKRPNYFGWAIFGLVVLFGYYFDQVYLPAQPNPFEPTPTPTRSPESLATQAQALFQEGKLPQAIEAYEEAIKASPQDPSLYIGLARIQVFAGEPRDAQANAENAILLSPNNSMAHAVRAWALDFQGENDDAMDAIDTALELDPNNAIAHAYKVEILIDSGLFENYGKAAEESKIALSLDPNALETRRARAYVFEVTGNEGNNNELAIEYYRSALEVNPNLALLHMELGRNLRFMEVYDQAIDSFIRANTLSPQDAEPDYLISRTYATIGEFAKALQYAETAVKDEPTNPRYRGHYGVMFYRNARYPNAVEQLNLAVNGGRTEDGLPIQGMPLSDDPRVSEYYFTYGLALARTYDCGPALQIQQTLRSRFTEDEIILEAADTIIQICEENLTNPPVVTPGIGEDSTLTPEPEATEAPALEATATP